LPFLFSDSLVSSVNCHTSVFQALQQQHQLLLVDAAAAADAATDAAAAVTEPQ